MFDIGFWELVLIGGMGLVILGPERLPVAIRTVRGWIAGARSMSDSVKTQLDEELRIHELQSNLKKAQQTSLKEIAPELSESITSLNRVADTVTHSDK